MIASRDRQALYNQIYGRAGNPKPDMRDAHVRDGMEHIRALADADVWLMIQEDVDLRPGSLTYVNKLSDLE